MAGCHWRASTATDCKTVIGDFYDRDTGELRQVLRFVAGREVVDWDVFLGRIRPET
jgi:hypothetical protein